MINFLKNTKNSKSSKLRSYERLLEVNSIISSSLNKDEVLKRIVHETKQLMKCEKCSVLLVDPDSNKLVFDVMTDEKDKKKLGNISLSKGEGIAGHVWKHGVPLVIDDTKTDTRFSSSADKKTDFKTRNLMAVPLSVNGKIIGVMEAINKLNNKKFNDFDVHLFQYLAVQAAVALENSKLYEMATTDYMTHLYIKRYFENRFIEEFKRATRYKRVLSIIMFDIDHFKKVNDKYGHQAGDDAIKVVSSIIKSSCRNVDIPCRFGGEEIVVLLPETDKSGALIFAERVRKKLQNTDIYVDDKSFNIKISGGVASLPEDKTETSEELLGLADKALYYSKQNGRNKITLYNKSLKIK